jgi:hypothetical protein
MKRMLPLVMMLVWVVGLMGQAVGPTDRTEGAGAAMRFAALDVVIDAGKGELGCYQVEVNALEGVKVVGIEGGDGIFGVPPFYDPEALVDGERIVVASFSTEAPGQLPRGRVRVARVHVTAPVGMDDAALLKMPSRLVVATDGDGKTIAARLSLAVYQGEK